MNKREELTSNDAKQERGSQLNNRNRWIQDELKSLNKQLNDKKDHRDKLADDLKRDGLKLVELEKRIERETIEMVRQRMCIDNNNRQYYELKKQKDQFQARRNDLWRKENDFQHIFSSLKEDFRKAGLNCQTLEGSQVSSKGSLIDGYFNSSCYKYSRDQEIKTLREELKSTENTIYGLVCEMQKMETKNKKAEGCFDRIREELRLLKEELSNIEHFRILKEKFLVQYNSNLEAMQITRENLESELHQCIISK